MVSLVVRDLCGNLLANELFESDGQADTWIRETAASRRFGRPERWIDKEDLKYFNEDLKQSISEKSIGSGEYLRTQYLFKAEYIITRMHV